MAFAGLYVYTVTTIWVARHALQGACHVSLNQGLQGSMGEWVQLQCMLRPGTLHQVQRTAVLAQPCGGRKSAVSAVQFVCCDDETL
jgi:hypothetical protein